MQKPPKRIAESRFTFSALMGPQDADTHDNAHCGVIMKMVDEAGALVAMRHACAPKKPDSALTKLHGNKR